MIDQQRQNEEVLNREEGEMMHFDPLIPMHSDPHRYGTRIGLDYREVTILFKNEYGNYSFRLSTRMREMEWKMRIREEDELMMKMRLRYGRIR